MIFCCIKFYFLWSATGLLIYPSMLCGIFSLLAKVISLLNLPILQGTGQVILPLKKKQKSVPDHFHPTAIVHSFEHM